MSKIKKSDTLGIIEKVNENKTKCNDPHQIILHLNTFDQV